MHKVPEIALICVGRAVMFGMLAIALIMLSFSFDPEAAFRAGAMMTLIMAAILLVKAFAVMRQKPKNTEVWIYLDTRMRAMDETAQRVFLGILRNVYARFARGALYASCILFAISLLCRLAGFTGAA